MYVRVRLYRFAHGTVGARCLNDGAVRDRAIGRSGMGTGGRHARQWNQQGILNRDDAIDPREATRERSSASRERARR